MITSAMPQSRRKTFARPRRDARGRTQIRDEEIAKIQEIARAYRASDLLLRDRKQVTFGTQIMDA